MKILFDTNILLDVILDRSPFASPASVLLAKVELGDIQGYLCATTVTTIYYLTAKVLGPSPATQAIEKLLQIFEIAPVNRSVLTDALTVDFSDFEDAVIYAAALFVGADALVTRDGKGFQTAQIPILNPNELAALLRSME